MPATDSKKPKKKEPWPRLTKISNHGQVVYLVDARVKGKGQRRMFADRKEAEGWQEQQRTLRINEGLSGVNIPEALRIEAMECQRRLAPHGVTLTAAVDYFLKHAKPTGGVKLLTDLVEEFLKSKRQAGRREEYLRVQESVLGIFTKAFPDKHVHEVGSADIEKWLDHQCKTLRTRRNYQNDVRNLIGFAERKGYIGGNPVHLLEKIILDDSAVEILTVEQAQALLNTAKTAGGEMVPYVAIGLFAGLRTREIAELDWRHVSIAEKTIVVQAAKTKTRARRIVEMSDNLVSILTDYHKEHGEVTVPEYRTRFEEVRHLAGISPWPRNAMRHSAASYHLAAHKNEMLTQAMLGHESSKMLFSNYRELVKPSDANLYWKIQ